VQTKMPTILVAILSVLATEADASVMARRELQVVISSGIKISSDRPTTIVYGDGRFPHLI
jgi:hypothetical protein